MTASDDFFLDWPSSRHVHDEGCDKAAQVEALVESVGKCCEIGLGLLAELQRLEGSSQRDLEIAQHGVDPLEFGQMTRLEGFHHPGRVDTACISDGRKACQPVAGDNHGGQQAGLGPPGDGFAREALDQIELQAHWLAGRVQRHRRYEGHLVLRAPADFATRALSSEVGVIQLHEAIQPVRCLLVRHGSVDLVVQQPGGGVAHPQIALERQGRDAGLGLADVEQLAGTVTDNVVLHAGATRAAKPIRPARAPNRLGTLRFGAKVGQKLRNRHAGLELDLVAGHT